MARGVIESILIEVAAQGVEVVAELADTFESLTKAADKAGKATDDAGDKAKDAGGKAKRAGVDLDALATSFRDAGDGGTAFGDALDAVTALSSPAGAGIGILVGGVLGATVALEAGSALWEIYADNISAAGDQADATSAQLDQLAVALLDVTGAGGAVTQGFAGVERLARSATRELDALRATGEENNSVQGFFARVTLGALEAGLTGVAGAAAPLVGIVLFAGQKEQTRELDQALSDLNNTTQGLGSSLADVADNLLRVASAAAEVASQEDALEFVQELRRAAGAGSAQGPMLPNGSFRAPRNKPPKDKGKGKGRGRGRGRRGGSRRQDREKARAASSLGLVNEFGADLLQDPDSLGTLQDEGFILTEARRADAAAEKAARDAERNRARAAQKRQREVEAERKRMARERERALEQERKRAEELANTYRDELAPAMAEVGAVGVTAFGEMIGGAQSLSGALAAVREEIKGVVDGLSSAATRAGAQGLIDGTAGAGGVLAGGLGIGLAAGIVGGLFSSGGGGGGRRRGVPSWARENGLLAALLMPRGGRNRGRSNDDRLADSIDRLEQTLRPHRNDQPVVLNAEIVIAGRTVQQELTGALGSIIRTSSSRELFRSGVRG